MRRNFLKIGLFAVVISCAVLFFVNNSTANPELTAAGEEKGIQFIEQDWKKALQLAKTQKKLVFLDIYATWCGPCKMLKKNTFTDEKVAAFFNENFINISVDGEKSVGPELARKYSIEGYPTLIFTDAEGNPVLYTVGFIDADKLMQFAKAAMSK